MCGMKVSAIKPLDRSCTSSGYELPNKVLKKKGNIKFC